MPTPNRVSLAVLLATAALAACTDSNEPPRTPVPDTGTLRITTSTAGVDPDADGYALFIDTLPQVAIGSNTSQQLVTVAPGTYQVLLDGVAANCVLAVPAPVEVFAGLVVDVVLNVTCTPMLVDLRVATQSSGEDIDHSGYVVMVDGQPTLAVPASGAVVVRTPHGSRAITLGERASNCIVTSGPAGNVNLPLGVTTDVQFSLNCVHTPKLAIVITGGTYSVNPDGTGFSRIGPGIFPEWSPDGQRVVTSYQSGIYMMNADSTEAHQVQFGGKLARGRAAWSPDGARLAVALQVAPDTVSLFVCDTNGANLTRISSGSSSDLEPSWSPFGDQVVFTRGEELFLAQTDGSRILFIGPGQTGERRATLIDPDGGNRTLLQPLASRHFDDWANWSSHGTRALVSGDDRNYQVDITTGEETATLVLPGSMPAWRD